MQIRKWKYHVTNVVLGYLCITVFCKKSAKDETYGDLGDEIIVDYPTQPTRKNQIPKSGDPDDVGHIIDQRTIMQKTAGHYLNPLYYREFIPAPRSHRQRISVPVRVRYNNNINTWRKKDFIHRPVVNRQPMSYIMRPPIPSRLTSRPLYPRTLSLTVRKKLVNPKIVTTRRQYRPPVALKQRLPLAHPLPIDARKVRHHIHVQVIPKSPLNPIKAQRMGIHSGFVLLPAQSQKLIVRKMAPRPRVQVVRKLNIGRNVKPPGPAPITRSKNRFTERKHIWIPSSHMNAQEIPIHEMTSYHVDDIGNLIPDGPPGALTPQPERRIAEDPLIRDLGKVAMKWAQTSPTLRRNIQNNPRWLDALENAMKQKEAESSQAHIRELSRVRHPDVKPLPRTKILVKPPIIRSQPKSSRRIIYFAHNASPNKRITTPNIRYHPYPIKPRPISRYPDKRQRRPPPIIEPMEYPLGPPIISKEFIIPKVSNKVFRYINDRTVQSPVRPDTRNPLLRYLQYHRIHPSNEDLRRSPITNSAHGLLNTKRMANMQQRTRKPLLIHNRVHRDVDNRRTSLTSGRERRAVKEKHHHHHHHQKQEDLHRRNFVADIHNHLPLSSLFRPGPGHQSIVNLNAAPRKDVPWNFYHNEMLPDGRIRPALYPISHHIPPGKCLPDGSLCDEGHDEQCCGRSAFCQNYWGISKCVAYSKVTLADMHNPYQIQQNRVYKHFYRYMLSKVMLR